MKYKILSLFKKLTAAVMSLFMLLTSSGGEVPVDEPEANLVSDYDISADYSL